MIPVESSNIKALGFQRTDTGKGDLHVQFKSGDTYRYSGVTDEEMADLIQAKSIGSHHAKFIKGKYQGVKI